MFSFSRHCQKFYKIAVMNFTAYSNVWKSSLLPFSISPSLLHIKHSDGSTVVTYCGLTHISTLTYVFNYIDYYFHLLICIFWNTSSNLWPIFLIELFIWKKNSLLHNVLWISPSIAYLFTLLINNVFWQREALVTNSVF